MVMARWEEEGKPKRWRGTPADMAANIPAGAAKLEVEQTQRRVETFVTVGTPSDVKAVGKGLELVPIRHPNDLYAGEAAKFRFLLDGKPAKDLAVEIIAGGTRYRDAPAADGIEDRCGRPDHRHLAGDRALLARCRDQGRERHRAGREETHRGLQRHA